ncbi:retrovirus-related pol polyprotein from transposon TNT 1-94, partial [Tanacetum coccineum]
GRQNSFATGTSGTRANFSGTGGNNSGQQRIVKCFNCQGEGHMARQCLKPKRKRDATWFRDKVLLVETQGSRKVLNEEELEFLADSEVAACLVTQTVITHNATYQADDLDAYDSDCDDFSKAKAVLVANLSSYGSDVLSEVVQIVLWYLDSRCSKHMTGDRSQLTNFVHKFLGTVKFGNDQIAKIMGYDLKVAFRKHTYFVRNLEGVDLLSGYWEINLYTLSIGDMMASSPICLLSKASKTKSWLWHRRLSHLNFGAINHLAKNGLVKFLASKDEAPDFIIKFLKMIQVRLNTPVRNIRTDNGTEFVNQTLRSYYGSVVATACYTQNRSIIRHRHGKTPYEFLHDRKPDLSYLHVFGALCYPNNDSDDLGKLQAKVDIGIFIGYTPKKKAYRIYNRRTQKIIETIHVDFDELTAMASEQLGSGPMLQFMTPATSSSGLVPNPIPQQPCIPPPRDDWDRLFQPMFDEYFNPPTIAVSSVPVVAAPRAIDLADSLVSTWTKDHPIANVIRDPSRSVSTRKQLQTDVMWCYFDAFLTSVEPKNFKPAMTKPSWIVAMQEEIHEFERLQVQELVPCPEKIMLIKTKMDLQGQDRRIWWGTKE